MVIFGGLEIVAGGYLLHRYSKNKNEKKRQQHEAEQRRHNSFPGAKPQPHYQPLPPHPQHGGPPQKYGYVANSQPVCPQQQHCASPHRSHTDQLPYRLHHNQHGDPSQSFMIPRRPIPNRQHAPPPQIIQPLQRADSMATISRMPIANGYRPSHVTEEAQMPLRRQNSQLSPISQSPVSAPYGNMGYSSRFATSSPALIGNTVPPGIGPPQHSGGQSFNDRSSEYGNYAPSISTALGEIRDDDDPPPPYRP